MRLYSPERNVLNRKDFEEYPVWTWNDENEGYLPLSERNPSPEDYGGLFIKSEFKTVDGYQFTGYLIGDTSFHAFAIFFK